MKFIIKLHVLYQYSSFSSIACMTQLKKTPERMLRIDWVRTFSGYNEELYKTPQISIDCNGWHLSVLYTAPKVVS